MASLTNIKPITNAVEYTLYNLNYGLLKTFANESATTRSFKITSFDSSKGSLWVSNGSSDTQLSGSGIQAIYVNRTGVTVVPVTGVSYTQQALKWKTPEFSNGTFQNVFLVRASDAETADLNIETDGVGITINAAGINQAPTLTTINTLTAKAVQGTAYSISYATLAAAANASDRDGDAVSFRIESISNGTLTINSSGTVTTGTTLIGAGDVLTWTPGSNGNATTAFTVTAWDGSLASSSAVGVTVNVDRSNTAPTISITGSLANQSITDGGTTLPLFKKDDSNQVALADVDNDNIKVTITLDNPAKGSLQIGSTGFTHNADGSYTYTGSPTAATTALQNLTFKPTQGRVAVGSSSETTTFKITVSDPTDSHLKNSSSAVTVVTTAANALPVVSDGATLTTAEDTAFYFKARDFTNRYSDANGDRLNKIQITTLPDANHGTLKLGAAIVTQNQEIPANQLSLLNFVPKADYNTTTEITAFQWKASDGHTNGYSTTAASLKLTITPVNDAPTLTAVANPLSLGGPVEGVPVNISYSDLVEKVATEADVDSSSLSFQIDQVTNGFLQLKTGTTTWAPATTPFVLSSAITNLYWTPYTGKSGSLTAFSVKAWDGELASVEAIPVKVTVAAVNHAPYGTDKTLTLDEDTSHTFQASDFGFYDPDGNSLSSISIESFPAQGTLKLNNVALTAATTVPAASIGQLTYTPAPDGNGLNYASFNFKVQDNGTGNLWAAAHNTLTFSINFGNTSVLQGSTSPLTPTAYDATEGSKNYLIDFSNDRNPGYSLITGFGSDDSLNISGISDSDLSIANRGADVLITANLGSGQATQITLTGIASPSQIIYGLASFNALPDAGNITLI